MTDANLYAVGYDVGFEDGFKEAQGRIEAKLDATSKMLPRAVMAILKDRKQEAIDVLETVIEELKGDSDG